ncbi:MAG: amidohydrolase family protein [Pseudomonadota bacterium]
MITQVTDLSVAYDPTRDELIVSALQGLWALPATGGEASALTPVGLMLTQPAVSPDGRYIVAEGGWQRGEKHLWLVDRASGDIEQLTRGAWQDTSAAWLPDASGVVFTSNRSGARHLWTRPLSATQSRALTRGPFEDTDPVANDAGDIFFVRQTGARWMLMQLLPSGEPLTRHVSQHRLSQPTIRRDGILTTVQRHRPDGGIVLDALLPRQEMLVKTLTQDDVTIEHPPVWLDRERYVTIDRGRLVVRRPATRGQRTLPLTIWVSIKDPAPNTAPGTEDPNALEHAPWTLRGAKVYDPASNTLLENTDIVIANGRIQALNRRSEATIGNVIDLGDVVLMPGLIDIDAIVTDDTAPRWLAAGVTRYATLSGGATSNTAGALAPKRVDLKLRDFRALSDNRDRVQRLRESASGRFITDQLLPDLTFGQALLDASWFERNAISSFEDEQLLLNRSGTKVTSHMAERGQFTDSRLTTLARSRLWQVASSNSHQPVITSTPANATAYGHLLIAATGNSSLPPGVSLIAELLAMHDAGVPMHHVIAAATSRSAEVLGRTDLGRIAVGATADLVILPGNPIEDPEVLLAPIGIVVNGRFSSIPSLLEPPQ